MPVSVLVVDDSAFFRQRVTAILNSDPRITVVGTAENGQVAIEKARELKPDVITMDYEMPVLNGIAALSAIIKERPVPVLMFSSLTREGARVTLQALEAGAVDFLPKTYDQLIPGKGQLEQVLVERVLAVAKQRVPLPGTGAPRSPSAAPAATLRSSTTAPAAAAGTGRTARALRAKISKLENCALVIIGTSTGGPVAVQKILTQLPADYPLPIVVVQHMPKAFTGAFAERLDQQCQVSVKEAQEGDRLKAGQVLLAPGGLQMMLESRTGAVKIFEGDERLNYKPSVDVTFGSAAKSFPGKVLGIVLTGMGADGREGARMLKQSGSTVWAQNEESCVIYGMPQAIVEAKLADQVLDISEVKDAMMAAVGR